MVLVPEPRFEARLHSLSRFLKIIQSTQYIIVNGLDKEKSRSMAGSGGPKINWLRARRPNGESKYWRKEAA